MNLNIGELEKNILSYGLETAGFRQFGVLETSPELKRQRFISFFGVCPSTCAAIFVALKTGSEIGDGCRLNHFLLTMCWMKNYVTERVLAGMFEMTEKTIRKWIWKYAKMIQSLKAAKVSVENYHIFPLFHIYISITNPSLFSDFFGSG